MDTKKMFYLNGIVGLTWLVLLGLIITAGASQMILAALFTVFTLHFSEDMSKKIILKPKLQKFISFMLSTTVVVGMGYILYKSFNIMFQDLGAMLETSQSLILETLNKMGVANVSTIEEVYSIATGYVKENVTILTNSATLLLKVIIGIALGIIFHFTSFVSNSQENAWVYIINKINSQFEEVYKSFRTVMSVQVMISGMNTVIISVISLGLTPLLFDGQFLPYWYVIIPLTAILSLIPTVGNVLINLFLFLSTVQLAFWYVGVVLALFVLIHKLEMAVIGKKMKEKININFIIIIVSMLLGEMLFHSMSGMVLGMVIVVTIANLLRKIKI